MASIALICVGLLIGIGLVLLRRRFAEFPGQLPAHYADQTPAFDLREHLKGKMVCEGIIFGPLGRVTSSFVADFDIRWDGDTCVMAEAYRYSDGSTQDREWIITLGRDGRFTVAASDVPGGGTGVQSGPTAHMRYPLKLAADAGGHDLKVVDWMYLTPDGSIMNRSQFRKFGVRVAELVATIRPVGGTT